MKTPNIMPLYVMSKIVGMAARMPVAIANLMGEHAMDLELMMAGAVLTVVPVLTLFFILQKQYIAGMMAGSVKG